MATEPQRGDSAPTAHANRRVHASRIADQIVRGRRRAAPPNVGRKGQVPAHVSQRLGAEGRHGRIGRPNVTRLVPESPAGAVDSLGITYREADGNWRSMHPDFVFFHEVNGEIVASIVDPHGHHLDDADIKLKALATFAAEYGDEFHRDTRALRRGGRRDARARHAEIGRAQSRAHGTL